MISTEYDTLPGFRTAYSETELRLAIAIAEVFIQNSLGGGGGGGGGSSGGSTEATLLQVRNRLMPDGTVTSYMGTSAGANLKSSAGNIYAISCSNANAVVRYFQVFNQTTAPSLGNTPDRSFPVYGSDGLLLLGQDIIGGNGIILTTGISWGFSTTRLTYTAATASDCIATVRWT